MNKMILMLVEDNPDDILLAQRALKKCGMENNVVVAHDGVEALEYLFGTGKYANRDKTSLPTVVLMDLKMPRMNGMETLQQIRSHNETAYLPVVILTSSSEEQDMLQSYEHGANSYIRKPVDFSRFLDVVESLVRYWSTVNEFPQKMG